MSTIQNLKNFIRHGKQARTGGSPQGDATTHLSPVTAQHQRYQNYAPAPNPHAGVSEPAQGHGEPGAAQKALHGGAGGFSAAPAGHGQNQAARAGDVAARAAGENQQIHRREDGKKQKQYDTVERIVQEERESKGKMPVYPGLERWHLVEKMGDGAFSNVYRAKDLHHQYQEVAIKVVRKYEMNSSQKSNILKEVQIMRKIDYPNIVKLIDFAEAKQYYYIILELCPGGELFHQIVRLTYFSEDLSRHVILQVAEALEYLHEEAGVVHRDIKPENLLFYPIPFVPTRNPKPRAPEDEDKADEGEFIKGHGSGGIGLIKVADFGLSKVIWDSQTMTPCGTVGYTAPEIVKDERYSKSVDMWALGCVLYTLLCGFPPFYDESIQVLTEKVARGQYTFLSPWWDDISKSAQDLVSHLLTVNPDKRYDIKQFLAHPWIRESQEETWAAADAPPLATPLAIRQREGAGGSAGAQSSAQNKLVEQLAEWESSTPGSRGQRAMDFRSPGAVNLREVFDVGYAVHRQEEEGKRRKNFPQGYRGTGEALNALNEDAEGDDYDSKEHGAVVARTGPEDEYNTRGTAYSTSQTHDPPGNKAAKSSTAAGATASDALEQKMRNTSLSAAAHARTNQYSNSSSKTSNAPRERGYGQHSPAVAAAARKQVRQQGPFELSLDNATMLSRRGKKPNDEPGSGLKTEVVQ